MRRNNEMKEKKVIAQGMSCVWTNNILDKSVNIDSFCFINDVGGEQKNLEIKDMDVSQKVCCMDVMKCLIKYFEKSIIDGYNLDEEGKKLVKEKIKELDEEKKYYDNVEKKHELLK